MSKRGMTNFICSCTGFEDPEEDFSILRSAGVLKHISRVKRNDRVRTGGKHLADPESRSLRRQKSHR